MTEKATAQDVIDTLKSIDQSLKNLVAHFGALRVPVNGNVPPSRPAYATPSIATDRDLDGKYGDPSIRMKDPRDWTGDSMLGRPFSECPIEYLEMWAERQDWIADQSDEKGEVTAQGKPKAPYQRADAARARGWAERKRTGWQPPAAAPSGFPSDAPAVADDDSIPFAWLMPLVVPATAIMSFLC